MAGLPTGTVTFLFTDIEGSTSLLQRLGDRRYAEVLAEHQRLLRDAFAKGNGREVDTQGDAFLVAFSRARDAVATAVAAQQSLRKHTWPDGVSLQVRMGLHTGEPISNPDRYVGLDVHRAARIGAAGYGGQILLSDAVSGLAARDLPSGVSLRDLGAHRLKDLKEPEHLLQVVHPDLPADFPPVKSLDVLPNNLPRQLTSFIGREKEMAEVKRLLSTAYLVTLTGSGGAGKTRLALQIAADVVENYSDGVWLAEFAPIADPALVPKTVASALNVPEQPGRDMTDSLVDALRSKTLLVVLDNCEHLLAACRGLTATLLQKCPQVRILATSREGLGVPGETVWRVPSLSLPDIRNLPASRDLVLYEAVRLFLDRATATAPAFTVTSENAYAVAQVCHRLDGIPLAVELAAARVKVLAVEQIAARLDDRFRLLTDGSPIALPRHQTLRAAIDWSYHLLSETERVLLRRLSVFAGGWTLEAAESVCAGGGVEADTILDLLAALVDKSLAVVETQGAEARYRLLETVRQYGTDKLGEAGEAAEVRRRHRDWYLDLAERAEAKLVSSEGRAWLNRLETEHDNLRAGLEWSGTAVGGAEAQLRLAGALTYFWNYRTHWSEGRRRLEEALARSAEAPKSVLPKALQGATLLNWRIGDYERGTALGEKGLALCDELGDSGNRAWLLMWLGILSMRQGDYARATTLFEESITLSRAVGNPYLTSLGLGQLGVAARNQHDYRQAIALHTQSLALFRQVGGADGIAYGLRNLGIDTLRQDDYGRAAAYFAEGLGLCYENKWLAYECLEGLAAVAHSRGDNARAARLFGAGTSLQELIGHARSPIDLADKEHRVASVRTAIGDAAFAAAWAEGRAMTLEQAIEYALQGDEASSA